MKETEGSIPMKKLIAVVVAVAFASPAFAQSTKPAAPANTPAATPAATTPAAKPAVSKDSKPVEVKKDEVKKDEVKKDEKKSEMKTTPAAGGTPTAAKTTEKPAETKKN